MAIFDDWCETDELSERRKHYYKLTEREDGRAEVIERLAEVVRSHYDALERIAEDIQHLGYAGAAAALGEMLPRTGRARAGDVGEILAAQLTEERLEFNVPVKRLRYKDGREVPMRGDDLIGVNYAADDGGLWLLKGEAKSRRRLDRTTITQAREALARDDGRCTPSSLMFVANRLLESDDTDSRHLGRLIRDEAARRALPHSRVDHALFTMSGNGPIDALQKDFDAAERGRGHELVNLHIEDYDDFLTEIYERAADLGDG